MFRILFFIVKTCIKSERTCKIKEWKEDLVIAKIGDAGSNWAVENSNVLSDDGMRPASDVCYFRKMSKQWADSLMSKVA